MIRELAVYEVTIEYNNHLSPTITETISGDSITAAEGVLNYYSNLKD